MAEGEVACPLSRCLIVLPEARLPWAHGDRVGDVNEADAPRDGASGNNGSVCGRE